MMQTQPGRQGPMGYGSFVVDGSRVPLQTGAAYRPVAFGQDRAGVPSTQVASVPPYVGGAVGAGGGGMSGYAEQVGGYGTADGNAAAAARAHANPFSPKDSPLVPALLALLIGLVGLRYVHWRG